MNPIHLPTLRRRLFGSDYIPREAVGEYPGMILTDWRGEVVCITTVFVRLQPSKPKERWNNHFTKPSGHRILVCCPECNKIVPAGRIAQHHRIHD